MSMVRFAMLCDQCGKRSREYGRWPECRDCSDDVCPDCCHSSDEETSKGICKKCEALRVEHKELVDRDSWAEFAAESRKEIR